MLLKVTTEQSRALFQIVGRIDESGAEGLEKKFNTLDLYRIREVVLDFTRVEYIASVGIGKIILMHKTLVSRGGVVMVQNASTSISTMFKLLKLDRTIRLVS
ncbi:MAG: STAS domain-containing protein [Deltaproteobacteria bacterium]|nr:STAS domain-containing protein [Deltaproteobacteria bacterium]